MSADGANDLDVAKALGDLGARVLILERDQGALKADLGKRVAAMEKAFWGVAGAMTALSILFGLFLDAAKEWLKGKLT